MTMPIDYKKYPANWKSELVPKILERAGHCCENCGLANHSAVYSIMLAVKNNEGRYSQRRIWFSHELDAIREANGPVKKIKVILTIAHLDHDEENHEVQLDRLKALCQSCHLRYDSKEKYRRQVEKWNNKNLNTNT